MRIISGKFGGRRLTPPGKIPARPTTDKAKEALFNILSNRYDLSHLQVLDLFAGTGNISFEFISRGSPDVVAVERNFSSVSFIKRVKEELGAPELQAVRADVFRFLKTDTGRYDLIFADPPYDLHNFADIVHTVLERKLLKKNGCLIIEHSTLVNTGNLPGFREKRQYGQSGFSFFEDESEDHVEDHE